MGKKSLNRRELGGMFLGTVLTGCADSPQSPEPEASGSGQNWAKTFTYSATRFEEPRDVAALQGIVRRSERLKALGSRHSFSHIADTDGTLISMRNFAEIGEVNKAAMTVNAGGGVKYGELCERLHRQGYAIHNLASLPHISIAGAISTATHGSGTGNGNLATAVEGLELVTADGQLRRFSRRADRESLEGVVVGLGALGFITEVTLAVQPSFEMRQFVYQDLPWAAVEPHFDDVMDAGYSVSLFTTWGERGMEEVWIKERMDAKKPFAPGPDLLGAKAATRDLHPISTISAEPCSPQMGVAGPWFERLPHFRMGFTPSSGEELQSEFFVGRKDAVAALRAVAALHAKVAPVLQISEIRAIKGDTLWMSPAYGRDSIAIHFTWKKDEAGVLAVLPMVEAALKPFGPRPHWGKVFGLAGPELKEQYPKLPEFQKLRGDLDPGGKLNNRFLNEKLGIA